jgi:hypothetical protein
MVDPAAGTCEKAAAERINAKTAAKTMLVPLITDLLSFENTGIETVYYQLIYATNDFELVRTGLE